MKDTLIRTPLQAGAALRRRRSELGLSQTAAADSIARRQATISSLENGGDARLSTLLRLLAVLDLELLVRPRTQGNALAGERPAKNRNKAHNKVHNQNRSGGRK